MRKIIPVFMAVLLSGLLSACSFFAQKTQELTVNTNPEGCKVFVNGQLYTAPVKMTVPTTSTFTVTAMKEGYQSKTETLSYTLSKTGMLDAAGLWLFLIPGLGLFSDGAFRITNPHLFLDLTVPAENGM